MSLSKDYKRLVYHTAKAIIARGENLSLAFGKWALNDETDTDRGIIIGRAVQLGTEPYRNADLCDDANYMFSLDVEHMIEKIKAKEK